jgi:hypothetical protein
MNRTISKQRELSKRDKKATTYRRVVAGSVNGRSVVQSDEQMEAYQFKTVPGYEHTLIWLNPTTPDLSKEQSFDRYPDSVVPEPGGTYSSLLRANRADIKVTQELLRYASSRVTLDTYTQAVTQHKRKAQSDVIRLLRVSSAKGG